MVWGFRGNAVDVLTGNSEVSQFAIAKVPKLPHGGLIVPPRMKVATEGHKYFLRPFFSSRQKMHTTAAIGDDAVNDASCERRYRSAFCIAGHGFLRNFGDKAMGDLAQSASLLRPRF
jgi:hypothetical protein